MAIANKLLVCSLIAGCLIGYSFAQITNLNKLCTDNYNNDACSNIARNETYECLEVRSKIGCFLNIDQGKHHFAIVDPEQALLAASFVSDNVVVIGEVSAEQPPYQTVVIVRKFYNNTFENLRGKRFCHPGFRHDELVTRYVLKEFENKIIDANHSYCSNNATTLVEKELTVLSDFFGSSCRPGPWVYDDDALDAKLKSKFSNLCELCGPKKCDVVYQVPFNDTLTCLIQNGGDVAVTSLSDALLFFKNADNVENFNYLCANGSTSDSSKPCTWTNQLNRLIVTEKTVANSPKDFLQYHMPHHLGPFSSQSLSSVNLEESLESVFQMSKSDRITFNDPVSLKYYVSARRALPAFVNNSRCQEVVKWCTLNDQEQQKCLWLQQAAINIGLEPAIQCVQSSENDTVVCLNSIQNGDSDLVFADINYGYIALKKGLTAIAYPETVNKDVASIVIAIRNDTTDINSFKDLKGRSACFPQYGGREWLAFIDTLKSKKVLPKSCDYSKIFSDFVGYSCVPGAKNKDYDFDTGDSEKLCSQCIPFSNLKPAKFCNADADNKYFGTDGALRCLSNKAGDYAVITIKDIDAFSQNSDQFKILSQTGSILTENGLYVDPNAALTTITSGELVAKNNTIKKDNIIQLLRGIEIEFGQSLKKLFKVFELFNGTEDLLFPDSTPGLTFEGSENNKYVENFKTLLKNSEQCLINPNSAVSLIPSTVLMILITLILRF